MYPIDVIRELFVNALGHQDFSMTGTGPMVEVFVDRIEFSNPGLPLIDVLRFIDHSPGLETNDWPKRCGYCECATSEEAELTAWFGESSDFICHHQIPHRLNARKPPSLHGAKSRRWTGKSESELATSMLALATWIPFR
jgi:hypothetical protein